VAMARLRMPWSSGPEKKPGKMVRMSKRMVCAREVQGRIGVVPGLRWKAFRYSPQQLRTPNSVLVNCGGQDIFVVERRVKSGP
jgi:hypothetical protein